MECIFIRHGIAVEPEEWEGAEARRPLTEKGKRRVRQAAAGLASMSLTPTHLLSSPFARARETADIIRAVLCRSMTLGTLEELAVGSTPDRLLGRLRTFPSDSIVLCVGHEPLLGELAALLLCGKVTAGFAMKKAGAALIHLPGHVMPGQGLLRWWLAPAQLRMLGKGFKAGRKAARLSDD